MTLDCSTWYSNELPGQSRTGGVLGAVPSAAVMGARRIFFQGGGNSGMHARNTLQHFQGQVPSKQNISFFRRERLCLSKGGGRIGVARILSGVHFSSPKKLTTFLVVALKTDANFPCIIMTPNFFLHSGRVNVHPVHPMATPRGAPVPWHVPVPGTWPERVSTQPPHPQCNKTVKTWTRL